MNNISSFIFKCINTLWNGYLVGCGKILVPVTVSTFSEALDVFSHKDVDTSTQLCTPDVQSYSDHSTISMTPEMLGGLLAIVGAGGLTLGYIIGKCCSSNNYITYNNYYYDAEHHPSLMGKNSVVSTVTPVHDLH